MEIKHGAIYDFMVYQNGKFNRFIECRCNVSVNGDEVWFTDKDYRERSGQPVKKLRDSDESFKHNDVRLNYDN